MRRRILCVFILITFLGLILFSFTATEVFYSLSVEHSKESLTVYMNMYDESLTLDNAGAGELSQKLGGARVTFLSTDGTVLADSASDSITENHADRKEVREALETGEGYDVRNSGTLGENMVYYCKRFGDTLVRIAVPTSSDWNIFLSSLPSLVGFLLADLVACFLFTYFASDFILKPIRQFALQAQQGKALVSNYEELRPIAEVLNRRNEKIVGDMKRIEEEKELALQAKSSKDEMIANITHEMNTPLTSIKGFAELLAGDGLSEEQRLRAVNIIRAQSERLSNLISETLHYSEIDSDELPSYDVDFTKLVQDALGTFEPNMREKNLTLHADIAEGIKVFSRYERLLVILNNLVGNAIRYNKEGGEISVFLGKENGFAKLSVSDTGVGIAEENLDKIFSRFFTVDKSHNGQGGGFGLGLAVVRKLCRKAGWTISVKSKLGEGTTFTIVF